MRVLKRHSAQCQGEAGAAPGEGCEGTAFISKEQSAIILAELCPSNPGAEVPALGQQCGQRAQAPAPCPSSVLRGRMTAGAPRFWVLTQVEGIPWKQPLLVSPGAAL